MKSHKTLNHSGKTPLKYQLLWILWSFFFLSQAIAPVFAKNNPLKDHTWPNKEQLHVIEQTIQNYPLEKQLIYPHRRFLNNAQPINVVKQVFDKEQNYSQITFQEEVKFFLTTFEKPVKFILSVFMKDVVFSNVISQTFINFEWAFFMKMLLLLITSLIIRLIFTRLFLKNSQFLRLKIYECQFYRCQF
ncbi:hypothetical protein Loa_02187 [Legionella oakridgensis ATCC 33761 = DSM 21215]|uniref:Uncharacterized protein n=1 Tax=Legionella oakridgensis ATCC 33761 = DSM 21215 TaxID=1268635 RepID=W0BH31_9GAMM|nr:hypothetical protein [Legionella oakridgensis]AHE67729.1 hypothetical protein Loa_02187 [Legionella oakridgensis ATCC 33761 = DSM 21215]